MRRSPPQEFSALLHAWSGVDESALDKLMPLVYSELHRLAHRYMTRERAGPTLQTTALVDFARSRGYQTRGGDVLKATLDEALVISSQPGQDLVRLDDALNSLAEFDSRKGRLSSCVFSAA